MPSVAYQQWFRVRSVDLDAIEGAHRVVGGTGLGRRHATQQLNQAYAVLLSSQFQGFWRDLHSECADAFALAANAPLLQKVYLLNFWAGRKLDLGNPSPGNLGADFNRFGLSFWTAVDADRPRNPHRKALLEKLNRWRNAIAHNSFAPDMCKRGRPRLHLADVQDWRRACDGLVRSFDNVLRAYLVAMTGAAPW